LANSFAVILSNGEVDMRSALRSRLAPLCGAVLLLFLATGCPPPVREDRTITFAPQGNAVGFQHGQEGVFVADNKGGGLTRIFQPGEDVLATSTPLWAPDGKRLVFTTARPAQGGKVQPRGEPDPAGNIYLQQPVVYTCWLRDAGEPAALFDAACDHVGY